MNCQACQAKQATVHVTELVPSAEAPGKLQVHEKHFCPACAQGMDLPTAGVPKKVMDIWKLLQQSSRRPRGDGALACPDCGMTLGEFRQKGRLGCPRDYEVFGEHLEGLLTRMHNADRHVGRGPGVDEQEMQRMNRIHSLRERLEEAIREEAYEHAAALRDELRHLQGD